MLDASDQRILADVENFGWHVVGVGPARGSDDPDETFAYTVGLGKTFRWPEIICFGLDVDVMMHLLNDAVAEVRERGVELSAGLVLDQVLDGLPARLELAAPMAHHYVSSARWFAQHEGLPDPCVLQLLWPDKSGAFPDDPGCVEDVRAAQTPLEAA
jgi:hypothetical protein